MQARGFAIISDAVLPESISDLAATFEQRSLANSRKRHAMRLPQVAKLATGPTLLGIARKILGASAVPFRATLFDKSPEANWLMTWHQDTALPLTAKNALPGWGRWSVKDGIFVPVRTGRCAGASGCVATASR